MNRLDLDAIIGRIIGIKCPECGKKSRNKVLCTKNGVYKKVKRNYCPYCGFSFGRLERLIFKRGVI